MTGKIFIIVLAVLILLSMFLSIFGSIKEIRPIAYFRAVAFSLPPVPNFPEYFNQAKDFLDDNAVDFESDRYNGMQKVIGAFSVVRGIGSIVFEGTYYAFSTFVTVIACLDELVLYDGEYDGAYRGGR